MLQAWWFKDSSLSCQQNNWNSTHPQLGNEPSTKVPHTASSAVIIFHLRSCSLDCAASSSSSGADAASSKCVIRNTATGSSQCACPTLVLACICSSSSLPPTIFELLVPFWRLASPVLSFILSALVKLWRACGFATWSRRFEFEGGLVCWDLSEDTLESSLLWIYCGAQRWFRRDDSEEMIQKSCGQVAGGLRST